MVGRYRISSARAERRLESVRLDAALGLLRGNRAIAGAALVSALLGVVGGVSGLLVPLALAANGLSAGAIGLAFGISAAVWIAAAAVVGRLRASSVHLHAVGLAVAVLAAAWLLPALRLSTLALVAFLLVSTACRSTINALNYAVGARASEGDIGADGDRRHEPRLGRHGARHAAARRPRRGERGCAARVRGHRHCDSGRGSGTAPATPRDQDRCTPIVIAATVVPAGVCEMWVSEFLPPLR